ncbi:MAG: hypothetical protein BM556_15725 [Bacteriovorax sp. MedPE-SWde]|nr:MAG: hypothetical protein BM556_15725 [Bacteriovorax sp. MedPE-SWde]
MPVLQRVLLKVLKDEFKSLNEKNKSFSLRAYARKLNLAAPELNSFINRKRKFSTKKSIDIINKTKLDNIKKNSILSFIESYKSQFEVFSCSGMYQEIEEVKFSKIKDWYYYVILSVLELNKKGASKTFLNSKINIDSDKLDNALIMLEELKLIYTNKGRYFFGDKKISARDFAKPESLREHHKQNITLAIESIEKYQRDQRSISGSTFYIDQDRLPEAFRMIDEFRKYFACYFADESSDSVYRVNIQLFPMVLNAKEKR